MFKKNFSYPFQAQRGLTNPTNAVFALIQKERQTGSPLNVKELCTLSGVSRSGYYRWVNAADSRMRREKQDLSDFKKIKEAYDFRGYAKGYRSICMRLLRMGIRMNQKKIRRLMKKFGLQCPIRRSNPYRQIARALKTDATAPNHVNREFRSYGPRKVLLTDITYLRLNKGFCYLSVIKDAFTMQALAYQLSESLEVDFVLDTIKQLLREHPDAREAEAWVHSDQGCHYTSTAFRELLKNAELRQSMSRRGNCWDNAPQESFFGHMKDELKPYIQTWKTFSDVKERIDDWMDYYNNDRYQTILKQMSPNEYYKYIKTNELPPALELL
ncbi:MAG TPA: IS3 family transposase [Candidatus Mediterraneibacter excrementavium]|nr:IS3 family transposase [Candidatus Mediterraneibacter excrementavium]